MMILLSLSILLLWTVDSGVDGFSTNHNRPNSRNHVHSTPLHMALPPIGPLCPFRSTDFLESNNINNEPPLDNNIAQDFAKLQSAMQLGQTPNPAKLRFVADAMDRTIDGWMSLFVGLQSTPDFCAREYARLMETHLNLHGTNSRSMTLLMSWQSSCLRALADNQPEPMPPAELDLEELMKAAARDDNSSNSSKKPSISAMQAAKLVSAVPLDAKSLDLSSESKQQQIETYNQLVREHSNLLQEGSNYNDMEPMEKLSYLDNIEAMEHKWDSFFLEYQLQKCSLNQDYVDACNDYLSCMKLTDDEFRRLIKVSHRQMRQDAEQEQS